jgi:hypothetical protein
VTLLAGFRGAEGPASLEEPRSRPAANKQRARCGMPLHTGRIRRIVRVGAVHRQAPDVHQEGTQPIGNSTATPHRRPAFDREGPSTVLLALGFPNVLVLVYPDLAPGHAHGDAHHLFPDETSPCSTWRFHYKT